MRVGSLRVAPDMERLWEWQTHSERKLNTWLNEEMKDRQAVGGSLKGKWRFKADVPPKQDVILVRFDVGLLRPDHNGSLLFPFPHYARCLFRLRCRDGILRDFQTMAAGALISY